MSDMHGGFDLYYSITGDGSPGDPVVVGFTVFHPTSLDELRGQLPDTVTLVPGPIAGGYRMTAVDPAMTRVDIIKIFDALRRGNGWTGKHMA